MMLYFVVVVGQNVGVVIVFVFLDVVLGICYNVFIKMCILMLYENINVKFILSFVI